MHCPAGDALHRREGVSAIARALNRHPSTISRELRRNACDQGAYRPVFAEGSYLYRRQRAAILEQDPAMRAFVVDRLAEGPLSVIASQSPAGRWDARADRWMAFTGD